MSSSQELSIERALTRCLSLCFAMIAIPAVSDFIHEEDVLITVTDVQGPYRTPSGQSFVYKVSGNLREPLQKNSCGDFYYLPVEMPKPEIGKTYDANISNGNYNLLKSCGIRLK